MKILFRPAFALLMAGLPLASAEARSSQWWYVGRGADRVLFIDAASIERDGDVAVYWASQVIRKAGDPEALVRAFMRSDCWKRQESWFVVTRYDAADRRLDNASPSYPEPQPVMAGTLGEAELDFVCAADRNDTGGFPIAIDEVAFAEALIADSEGSVGPADLHARMRANPKVPVIRSSAPGPELFGTEQRIVAGAPIVPPRDYAKGIGLPAANNYDADETGTIYDIAYQGIEKGQMVFELRGYSISDLAHAGSGQTMRFPLTQTKFQILDIAVEVVEVRTDELRYRVTREKREDYGVPDCAARDCEAVQADMPAR